MSFDGVEVSEGDVELEDGDFFSLFISFFLKLKGAILTNGNWLCFS